MQSFRILPSLGIKNDVQADDPSMFRNSGDGLVQTFCADGRNFDVSRNRNAASKSVGKAQYSNSAAATTTTCLGIYELYDGTNRVIWVAMRDGSSNGRLFRYDSSRDPVRVSDVSDHAGAVEFANGESDFYSFIKYAGYMIFADRAEHTPYCGDHNDATVEKLISSGTEYKFRYLESWQNRIFGAYSDQTNGDIDVRWSNLLPVPQSSCVFAAANQLYVPNDDPITGIKRMGRSNCFVYCEDSINRLIYYPDSNQPFSMITVVDNVGAVNHHSIIDVGGLHFFYNKDYGFVKFDGTTYTPISDDIENTINTIKFSTHPYIIGAPIKQNNEVVWSVALDSVTTPNALLFYNFRTGAWRRKDFAMRYVAPSQAVSVVTTMQTIIDLGYTTWEDLGNLRMFDFLSESTQVAYSNTDGQLYYDSSESDDGSAFDGYRIEPVMDFGEPLRRDLLLEIWFNLSAGGDYNIYLYHRGGDTVAEVTTSAWQLLPVLNCNNPYNAVVRVCENERLHQIKWGSSGAGEPFVVRDITFKYEPQGIY